MIHIPVLLQEILEQLPPQKDGRLLDVTAGGGGHFFSILREKPAWQGRCWDRDPDAEERICARGVDFASRYQFALRRFGQPALAHDVGTFDFILADLGISSFQIDDPKRGLSFHSTAPLDFRMNPREGQSFREWLDQKTVKELEHMLIVYGEEPRAAKFAQALKHLPSSVFGNSSEAAEFLMQSMNLKKKVGHSHPLTRCFQALRIGVNEELQELESFLTYAPTLLNVGGRLAVISFHSLEDRKVKRGFEKLRPQFKVLTNKALTPSAQEVQQNLRSRSAKLRVLERVE